jgi:hypothetical protein
MAFWTRAGSALVLSPYLASGPEAPLAPLVPPVVPVAPVAPVVPVVPAVVPVVPVVLLPPPPPPHAAATTANNMKMPTILVRLMFLLPLPGRRSPSPPLAVDPAFELGLAG